MTCRAPPPIAKLFQQRYIAPVEGAGGVVVDTARLAVVAAAVVRAGAGRPGDAVGRGPDAHALAAAAGGEEDGDPLRMRLVVDDDRVAEAGAVARQNGRVFRFVKVAPLSVEYDPPE